MATTKKQKQGSGSAKQGAGSSVNYHVEVLAQADGSLVKLGSMLCGAGARAVLSESNAHAAEKAGWVKLLGIA